MPKMLMLARRHYFRNRNTVRLLPMPSGSHLLESPLARTVSTFGRTMRPQPDGGGLLSWIIEMESVP